MGFTIQPGKKPYAVVVGLDSINGLRTARTLAKRDIPVIGIARDPGHYCCQTRVCKEIIFADTVSDGLIKTLEVLGPRLGQKSVLFPCNDLNVLPLSRHRQELEAWYYIILAEPDTVEMMMHKASFYAYAQAEGFPIPRTFMLNNRIDAEFAAQELTYPCILKPSFRSIEWDTNLKYKVYKSFTAVEFLARYECCNKWSKELIVQEWVDGPDSNLYTCYCYFDSNSEPLVTFVTRKLRQWPPEMGEGCLGEECRNDVVLEETVRLFKRVRFRGLGYLEMKRDAHTGQHLIMEPNIGRPTSKSSIAEAGGVELLYTMYCDALKWDLPSNREQKYGNAKWIFFRRDIQAAFYYWRRGELTLTDWWRSLSGKKTDALFSWTDMGPFISDVLRAIRLVFRPRNWT